MMKTRFLAYLVFPWFCFSLFGSGNTLVQEYQLSETMAVNLSELALKCIHNPYPNKPGHVVLSAEDVTPHTEYHPAFYGCFDWHSSVHGHWTLVRLLKSFPEMENASLIRQKLNQTFQPAKIQKELEYFQTEGRTSFERMYGWAWYLKLSEEILTWDDEQAKMWSTALEPLSKHLVQAYIAFLPKQDYPIRRGMHPNTAFGLSFAWDYATAAGEEELLQMIRSRARFYFEKDVNYPANYEMGGDNFLSPSLMEADLMARVLDQAAFAKWLTLFLPGIEKHSPGNLFTPAFVSDRTDGYIVHLDGLNLSRAWCMSRILKALPDNDPRRSPLKESAIIHATTALPELSSGHYEGEHWLGSFAVYMLHSMQGI